LLSGGSKNGQVTNAPDRNHSRNEPDGLGTEAVLVAMGVDLEGGISDPGVGMQQPAAGGEDLHGLWHLPSIWCPSVGATNPSTMGVGGIPRNQRHQRLPGGHRIGPRGCCVDHDAKTPENGEHSEDVLLPLVFSFLQHITNPRLPESQRIGSRHR
jgi:hypothetical protein